MGTVTETGFNENATATGHHKQSGMFDVAIDEKVNVFEALGLGLQNILGMTGLFLFPGLLALVYHLSPMQSAYLYGITFMTSGLVTILQSVFLLRLPIAQGPYAGTFAALMAIGAHHGNLGTAFGSLAVAGAIWCVLSIPLRRFSVIGHVAKYLQSPLVAGGILLIIMTQLTNVAFPNWLGNPKSPGFPGVNLLSGAVVVTLIIVFTLWAPKRIRRGAVLIAVIIGALMYAIFQPISFHQVAVAPVFMAPKLFPFGFGVNTTMVIIFFISFLPAIAESVALYQVVANWGDQKLTTARTTQGVFGEVLGSTIGALFGGMSTLTYPDNIGMLRTTRVGSRYVTLTAGILLLVLGSVIKLDMVLVAIPMPLLAAAGTLLFGMIFMSGVEMLSKVHWTQNNLIVAGLSFTIAIGGMFVPAAAVQKLPEIVQSAIGQPLILGTILLIVLRVLLDRKSMVEESTALAL